MKSKETKKMTSVKKPLAAAALSALLALSLASSAMAEYGITSFDITTRADAQDSLYRQAGGHPFDVVTEIEWNSVPDSELRQNYPTALRPDGDAKDILADLPLGFTGNPAPFPQCTYRELSGVDAVKNPTRTPTCPPSSQLGIAEIGTGQFEAIFGPGARFVSAVFNMVPSDGAAASFGFNILGTLIILEATVRDDGTYGLTLGSRNTPQALRILHFELTFWGYPGDPVHDEFRCTAGSAKLGPTVPPCPGGENDEVKPHPSTVKAPFITLPATCSQEGEPWTLHTNSWEHPEVFVEAEVRTHEAPGYPSPPESWGPERGIEGCDAVPSNPTITAQPTASSAETPSGLNVSVEVPTDGLLNPEGIAQSHIKRVSVTLPEGMSINPSQGEGLGACTEAQLASEDARHTLGTGCPSDSRIGSAEVKTPLLEETLEGSIYIAKPYENRFGSLLAIYLVIRSPERGVVLKLAGKVEPDPRTGQLTTTFDDLPQQPFESFTLRFREGQRSPLSTPAVCGSFETVARFTPWANPHQVITKTSAFQVTQGVHGGPCPSGQTPPFKPDLQAGTLNNRAGSYSPFNVRLTRDDGEQEFTNFSIKLPPGISGKLAGVPFCPDAAIAAAKGRSGTEEIALPSCPAASQVGRTLAGAGVGSVLTYAPGKIYLAGPYNGSALSIVSITAAKVGPFDLGTVVVRLALRIDPETAEVFVDATGSDPIPHIIDGIIVHLRDIRAYVDKHEFTLNPTSCERTSTASTLLGSGLDFASALDDRPVTVSTPFQAADCAALGFKPRLKLLLKGGTKRGGHPALRATYTPRPGDANLARAQVTLPKASFLDQSNIGTVCTRVQYAKDACPAKSIYGYAKATTPILDEALQGPVYLRSSEHKLPDLVAGLKSGKIEIDLVGKIDSLDGRIRTTFEAAPDAPVSKFILNMQGAKKGLIENSTNLCKGTHRAIVEFDAHNGKVKDSKPAVKADCKRKPKKR